MDQSTKNKPVITPELIDSIFTDEVLSVLPADRAIKVGVALEMKWQDPDFRSKQKESAKRRSTVDRGLTLTSARLSKTEEEQRAAIQKSVEKRQNNTKWIEAQRQDKLRRRKPIMTPAGAFESLGAASEYFGYKDRTGISSKLKTKPTEWYYITVEEYEQQTNNHSRVD